MLATTTGGCTVQDTFFCAFTKHPKKRTSQGETSSGQWIIFYTCYLLFIKMRQGNSPNFPPKIYRGKKVLFFFFLAWQNLRNLWTSCAAAACICILYWPKSTFDVSKSHQRPTSHWRIIHIRKLFYNWDDMRCVVWSGLCLIDAVHDGVLGLEQFVLCFSRHIVKRLRSDRRSSKLSFSRKVLATWL